MKATLPEYPTNNSAITFKDRRVPGHWLKYRLRFLLQSKISNGLFKKAEFWGDEGAPIVNVGDVYVNDDIVDLKKLGRVQCTEAELKTYEVKHGDIFFVRSSLKLEGIGKPAVVVNPTEPTVFECHLVGGRPDTRKVDPRFLIRFLNSAESRSFLVACAKTATMTTIEQMRIKDLEILCPPISEQIQIVTFLDRETAEIDRLIKVRRKQVERMQEQRTAIIHHSVTKGLDPKAKMKPSGVEWLGDVPDGWQVYRIRHLLRPGKDGIRIGPFGSSLKAEFIKDEGYKVYGQENVIGRSFELGRRYIDQLKYAELAEYTLRPSDVLITMMGSIGRCIVVPEGVECGIMDSHLIRIGVDKRLIHPDFLAMLIEEASYVAGGIRYESKGSIMEGLNSGIIKRIPIAFPSLREQKKIMGHIARETAKLDTLAAKYGRELDLLEEYRASLISHAVTGKIDVRGLGPPSTNERP